MPGEAVALGAAELVLPLDEIGAQLVRWVRELGRSPTRRSRAAFRCWRLSLTLSIERPSLEQLAALLLERAGLKITPDGYYGLRLALQARMPALGITDAAEYVGRLKQRAGEHELRSLIPLVTVGKTEFFRDTRQFLAFEKSVLPRGARSAGGVEGRQALLWSAGCATGEEPYSLSMVALERGGTPETVDIWATDLNPAATESASRAFFPARRLVGVSEERIAALLHRRSKAATSWCPRCASSSASRGTTWRRRSGRRCRRARST